MNNPSGLGGLMEGIASGVSGGMENYAQLAIAKINKEEKRALFEMDMSVKLFTNKDLPAAIRKKAWKVWQKGNKAWNTGLQAPDISDEMWESNTLDPFLKKLKAAMVNKDLNDAQRLEAIREIETEVIAVLGIDDAKVVGPFKEQVKEQAFAGGIGMLTEEKVSPEARGLLSMTEKGRGVLAERSKLRDKDKFGIGQKPNYFTLGGKRYMRKGGKTTVIAEGSALDIAISRAKSDPDWEFTYEDPQKQADIIEKWLNIVETLEKRKKKRAKPHAPRKAKPPKGVDFGASNAKEGTTATNKQGVQIITKGGRWIPYIPELEEGITF